MPGLAQVAPAFNLFFTAGAMAGLAGASVPLVFLISLVVLVATAPIWGDLRPGQSAPFSYLPWLTVALIAVGVVYMLVLNTTRPRVMANAATLLEGDESAAVGE